MAKRKPSSVDEFLNALEHRRKDEVEFLRQLILACSPKISEQIKWNAPSFGFDGDDRVTMRLQPKDRVELVFHRGVEVKDSSTFRFDDPSALLEFKAPDRAVIAFENLDDIKAKKTLVSELVTRWMTETS
jgi:hypothetical protein